ncbi:MAG TPA: efflux RND transporter periplasmic adaptor subunit [Terriglobia bacterium]|jgi:RND family efflux transporter MFP subunit|nr:efflux RND transporter periplasmic adaptor subunit [Terriglobia bacterium]
MTTHPIQVELRQALAQACIAILLTMLLLFPSCSRPTDTEAKTGSGAAPVVPVVKVTRRNLANKLEIASEFRPFQEIDVHAKESGYIKNLYIDWGTHVRTGQLLAVLEIPELEEEVEHDKAAEQSSEQALARAHEELTRSQSVYAVAHLTSTRLAGVQKTQPGLVAQEEVDMAAGKDQEASAEVSASRDAVSAAEQELAAAKATLQKDQALYAYARITAPFDGVVTELDAYTGALLPAGTSTSQNGLALCHLSQNDLLRLVIPVPETVVPDVQVGEPVQVRVTTLRRTFQGKVTRFSDQIDLQTRTMHTEVQVPNANYELVPGMYAYVEIPTVRSVNVLAVPIQAVERTGEGAGTVLVVNGQHAVESRNVKLGMETADDVEITSGLEENELVIFGEQNRYRTGEIVKPRPVSASGAEEGQ